ncbi:flavin reductase family protein [Methyloversatilis universalis]|uniref:flavin reductase family protein n=1 Tax=Methyloversatilis universalis TaxID=378211 RepID=UPI0003827A85|nr:flavin reductase family protein [Methyloversatilis universalis]
MARQSVALAHAYRLLNHGPTVLVGAASGDRHNVMAAAWCMPLDFEPPKIAVVLDKATHTRELIEQSGEFAISVPPRALLAATVAVGNRSGRDGDKFGPLGLHHFTGDQIAAPLIEGCVAWLECRVLPEPHNQSRYDLFIGEVVAASADDRVFSGGRWHFGPDDDALRTLHHVAGGAFFVTGEPAGGD